MRYSSRVRLLVSPRGPIGEIAGVLPDSWFRVVFPFAHSVRVRQHECQLIEVKPPQPTMHELKMLAVKSSTRTYYLFRVARETRILSAILRLAAEYRSRATERTLEASSG
jgi:hypothetical protein